MRQEKTPTEGTITREPLPASKKIYVPGTLHNIKVAMREIELSDTVNKFSKIEKREKNPSVVVYDTSGPFTDPDKQIDLTQGIERIRQEWILQRGDVEELQDVSSEYGKQRLEDESLNELRFEHL